MDYLTQHYKNLSEQLQAKVNSLIYLLEEYSNEITPDIETYKGKSTEELKTKEKMPEFHDSVVRHFANTFANKYGEDIEDVEHLTSSVAKDFHISAGKGGFKNFAHASNKMYDYLAASDLVKSKHEDESARDEFVLPPGRPRSGGFWGSEMDDQHFPIKIEDDHKEIVADVLHLLLK